MANGFDEISKVIASGISRREALRRIGGGLVGATLAALGVGQAAAAPSSCSVFCGKNAFTSGPLHAACLQACHKCGGDTTRVCCTASGCVCCPSGQICGFNCNTNQSTCCTGSTIPGCQGTCENTCCI